MICFFSPFFKGFKCSRCWLTPKCEAKNSLFQKIPDKTWKRDFKTSIYATDESRETGIEVALFSVSIPKSFYQQKKTSVPRRSVQFWLNLNSSYPSSTNQIVVILSKVGHRKGAFWIFAQGSLTHLLGWPWFRGIWIISIVAQKFTVFLCR